MPDLIQLVLICVAAVGAAGLTLFSGFGLGTILMPVFALFFPVPAAVAATAVVHLANNLFKLVLVGRHADGKVVLRFGVAAVLAAGAGAALLGIIAGSAPLATYQWAGQTREVTLVKVALGLLILLFAIGEMSPRVANLAFDRKWLPLGGLLSGFFGGLSGNQGALRSAFLIKCGLTKQAFIGTGVVCAVLVDLTRLPVYGAGLSGGHRWTVEAVPWTLLAAACLSAFVGSYLGARLIHRITLRAVQWCVAVMLAGIALGMISGVV